MSDQQDNQSELIEKLRASEDRARTIFESVQVGIMVQAADGRFTYANRVAEQIFALPAGEITDKTSEDPVWQMVLENGTPVPAEDHPSMITLRTGQPMRNEVRGLFAGDPEETRWLLINTEPVFGDDGETPSEVIITFNDITEQINDARRLRESEERYRLLFETAQDAIFIADPESGMMLDCNRKGEELIGRSREELRRMHQTELHPPQERRQYSADFGRAASTKGARFTELEVLHRDGHRIPVEISSGGTIELGGRQVHFGIFRDISERKETESALRHSESLFRKVFELLPVGLWLADRQGKLLEGNPMGVKIWGGSPLVPQEDYGVFKARRLPSGEEIAPDDWALARTVNEGVTIADELLEIDAFDGVTRTIRNYTAPVLGDDGKIMAAIVVNHDITEQKKAEAQLRESEERYRSYVDNAPYGIFICDEQGRYLDLNRAASDITGFSREELLGMSITDIVAESDLESGLQHFQRVLETGRSSGELRFRHKEGYLRHWSVEAVKIADNRLLGFVTDITDRIGAEEERQQLEQQLHQSQRMEAMGRLAGGVAHDFNNLLTVINGFSELLLENLTPEDPMRVDVEEIRGAARTAASLTEQLLAFSRRQIIAPRVLDLKQKFPPMESMLRRLIGEDIELVSDHAADTWNIRFDPGQVDQVLVNLAVNARDAMMEGGTLTIRSRNVALTTDAPEPSGMVPEGEYVKLTVSDSGCGMPPETVARIFDPFFTTKEVGKGTGLGLATVYGILEQNDSHITVESEVGRGSTFRIFIPRHRGSPGEAEPGAADLDATGTETILVVEDQDMVRALAERVLRSHGYQVISARDGGEALIKAEAHDNGIDLVLTDMVMPKMSGKDLVDRLARLERGIRVLYMSGYTDDAIARHGIFEGGDHFIRKPFSPGDLVRQVRRILDS